MKYRGSCHCGQVAFEAEGDIGRVVSCNCSICSKKGALLWFVPRAQFQLLTPPDDVAGYTFAKHVIRHCFCPRCGIHTHGEGKMPNGEEMRAINVRCLEGVNVSALPGQEFDGRSL